ncbi:unnamed protein product [Urochloa decumbens]|uniref:DUF1618 domain-containing protein n=1 Tax=Urochloa decumbens TaxID=240449 RepID=A0ABC8XQ86_9POAL
MDPPIPAALMLSMPQTRFRVQDASLRPPDLAPDDEGADIPWVLLDGLAYVAERNNATTAFAKTWDGHQIQVTLFPARPPRVSHLCVFCPGLEHTVFPLEPKILATELRIIVTTKRDILKHVDYYIYQAADDAAGGGPSLKRLPRPPSPYGFDSDVGILRCGISGQRHHAPRPHRGAAGDYYIVAGLCRAPNSLDHGEFVLCLHNSNSPTSWSTHNISLDEQHRRQYGCGFTHVNSKVIAIGGDAVTDTRPIPYRRRIGGYRYPIRIRYRYVTLVKYRCNAGCDAGLARDIAVVQQGRTLKYVELQVYWKACPTFRGRYVNDGWMSRTWSRPVTADCSGDCWDLGCKQESSEITVYSKPHFELPPKVLGDGGMPQESFKGLEIRQPTLSLHDDDDTVYFMTNKNQMDDKASVIAVDMKNNTLQGVAEFASGRAVGIAYTHSRISKYLMTAPGC